MEVYLLRHGDAVLQAPSDALRPLSKKGERDVASVAKRESDILTRLDRVCVSPYLRAQQTAKRVMTCNSAIPMETLDFITPNGNLTQLIDYLYQCQQERHHKSVLVVTHNPFVTELVHVLCRIPLGQQFLDTASMAAIDFDVVAAGCGDLRWVKHASD